MKPAAVLRLTLMENDRMGSFDRALGYHLGLPAHVTDGNIEAHSG